MLQFMVLYFYDVVTFSKFALICTIHIQKISPLSNCSEHYYFHTMEVETEAERFTVAFLSDLYGD